MAEYVLSERSKKDLKDIADHARETWSEEQAVLYCNHLLDGCEFIAEKSGQVGRSYEAVRPDLHGCHCHRHVIFFRIMSKESVRIVRILHDQLVFSRQI